MKLRNSIPYLLIVVLVAIIYGRSLSFDYNLDDEYVTRNHELTSQGIKSIGAILKTPYYDDKAGFSFGYRPVTLISFAIEHQLFDESPAISRFFNLLIYLSIGFLMYYFLSSHLDLKDDYIALFITLIFLGHTLHTEAVISIKNRDELLSFFFALSALVFAFQGIKKSGLYLFLAILCVALSVYSKNSSLAFLVCVPILVSFYLPKTNTLKYSIVVGAFLFWPIFSQMEHVRKDLIVQAMSCLGVLYIFFHHFNKRNWGNFVVDIIKRNTNISTIIAVVIFVILGIYLGLFTSWGAILLLLPVVYIFYSWFMGRREIGLLLLGLPLFLFLMVNTDYLAASLLWLTLSTIHFSYNSENPKLLYLDILAVVFMLAFSLIYTSEWMYILSIFSLVILRNTALKDHILFKSLAFIPMIVAGIFFLNRGLSVVPIISLGLIIMFGLSFWKVFANKKFYRIFPVFLLVVSLWFSGVLLVNQFNSYQQAFDGNLPESERYVELDSEGFKRPIDFSENPILYCSDLSDIRGIQIASSLFYLSKTVLPIRLSSYYGYNSVEPEKKLLKPLIIVLCILGLSIYLVIGKYTKLVFWALGYGILHLISISNIVTPIPGIVADRLAFGLVLPFAILLVILFVQLNSKKILTQSILFICIMALTAISVVRTGDWKDKEILYQSDLKKYPNSSALNALLATVYATEAVDQLENEAKMKALYQAQFYFEKAIEIYPNCFNCQFDLARVCEFSGQNECAIKYYKKVLLMNPKFIDARIALGEIYLKIEKYSEARPFYEHVNYYYPTDTKWLLQMSTIYYNLNLYDEALSANQQVINLDPLIPESYLNKAYIYAKMGKKEEFVSAFNIGRNINPNHPDVDRIRLLYDEFLILSETK